MKHTSVLVLGSALGLALAGCNLLQQLEGSSSSGAGGASASSATGAGAGAAVGVDCGVDPDTGVTLCLGTSLCPGLLVNSEVFPACGFRINGTAVDVECSCGGMLCPLGAPTCAQVQAAMMQSTEGIVCAQVGTGACVEASPGATGATGTTGAATTTGSGGGSCDHTCQSECGGDPGCLQLCGC